MFRKMGLAGLLLTCCLLATPSEAATARCSRSNVCGDFFGLSNCCSVNVIYYNSKVWGVYYNFNSFCNACKIVSKRKDHKKFFVKQFYCQYR